MGVGAAHTERAAEADFFFDLPGVDEQHRIAAEKAPLNRKCGHDHHARRIHHGLAHKVQVHAADLAAQADLFGNASGQVSVAAGGRQLKDQGPGAAAQGLELLQESPQKRLVDGSVDPNGGLLDQDVGDGGSGFAGHGVLFCRRSRPVGRASTRAAHPDDRVQGVRLGASGVSACRNAWHQDRPAPPPRLSAQTQADVGRGRSACTSPAGKGPRPRGDSLFFLPLPLGEGGGEGMGLHGSAAPVQISDALTLTLSQREREQDLAAPVGAAPSRRCGLSLRAVTHQAPHRASVAPSRRGRRSYKVQRSHRNRTVGAAPSRRCGL